jgi:hypothetical protein
MRWLGPHDRQPPPPPSPPATTATSSTTVACQRLMNVQKIETKKPEELIAYYF